MSDLKLNEVSSNKLQIKPYISEENQKISHLADSINTPGGDNKNDGSPRKKKNIGLRSEDFNLKLGKVVDTLNSDYPLIFVKPLDYSIYIDEIEVTDPTGIAF